MSSLSIQEAREIMGDESEDASDEQVKEEIETAELFKNIFFDVLTNRKLKSSYAKSKAQSL